MKTHRSFLPKLLCSVALIAWCCAPAGTCSQTLSSESPPFRPPVSGHAFFAVHDLQQLDHAPDMNDNKAAAETLPAGEKPPAARRSAPGGKARADYELALSFIRQEKYAEALPHLEHALQHGPENVFIQGDYVMCLTWTGAYRRAADFFLQHEQELKKLAYVARSTARAFYELGSYEKARELYEAGLVENPSDAESFKGVVYCLVRMGALDEASQRIEEASRAEMLAPPVIALLRADLLHRQQNYTDAYLQYLSVLQTARDEALLLEAQDLRRQVFGLLPAEDLQRLFDRFRDDLPVSGVLLIDSGRPEDLPGIGSRALEAHPLGMLLELGWGYFRAARDDESCSVYRFALQEWPQSCLARIGIAYPLARRQQYAEARANLQEVFEKGCFELNALFAEAFIYEQQKDFLSAMAVYEKILKGNPRQTTALKLKIRTIADLGAPSLAHEEARRCSIQEQPFLDYLTADLALTRLQWAQTDRALPLLEELLSRNPANSRARYDYIVALRTKERMQEAVDQFLLVEHEGAELPWFVTEAAADAYLYLQQPSKALHYYRISLAKKPVFPFYTLMGLFYTFQELREWKQAEEAWKDVEAFVAQEKQLSPWLRLEAFQARGWYWAYQDRLRQAQNYFEPILKQAGMNSATRNALGYIYLWRGWPRRALEELKIAQNVELKEFSPSIQNGIVLALNELNYKDEARALAEKLRGKFPRNKHVQDVVATLRVEDMNEFWIEGRFVNETPGATEYWIRSSLTEPIIPTFRLFQEFVWQETSDDGEEFHWNRAGLGCEWIVDPEVVWRQAVSFDYEDSDDFGYSTTVTWLPTDHFRITAGYDSFLLDIPIRARAEGIEGENAFLDVYYHESDLRYYGCAVNINWLDDGNRGSGLTLYYDQNILNTPDFKIRCGAEFNYSANSKQDVDYFSPLEGYTLVLNQTFHYIHYQRYNRKFRSSVYTREGFYAQHGFQSYAIYGITYEQSVDLSKSFAFVWNIAWDRRVYDGDSTHVWSGFCGLRKNF